MRSNRLRIDSTASEFIVRSAGCSFDVVFADYGVQVPTAPVVVSAEDHRTVELQLFLTSPDPTGSR